MGIRVGLLPPTGGPLPPPLPLVSQAATFRTFALTVAPLSTLSINNCMKPTTVCALPQLFPGQSPGVSYSGTVTVELVVEIPRVPGGYNVLADPAVMENGGGWLTSIVSWPFGPLIRLSVPCFVGPTLLPVIV